MIEILRKYREKIVELQEKIKNVNNFFIKIRTKLIHLKECENISWKFTVLNYLFVVLKIVSRAIKGSQ